MFLCSGSGFQGHSTKGAHSRSIRETRSHELSIRSRGRPFSSWTRTGIVTTISSQTAIARSGRPSANLPKPRAFGRLPTGQYEGVTAQIS
ncbi:hypothetical protein CC79DRAFT_1334093 [Sarocladium strictum]